MAQQINKYPDIRTAANLNVDDLLDLDATDDGGSNYLSRSIKVSEVLLYLNQNINTFYLSDGTLVSNRVVTSGGNETQFLGGDIAVQMSNAIDDYGFKVKDSLAAERAYLYHDQINDSGALRLTDSSLTYFVAENGIVLLGGATQTNNEILSIEGRFKTKHDDYAFNNTTVNSSFANNLGNILEFTNGGGVNLNNYNNGQLGNLGTQDFNSYFVDYNLRSSRNANDINGTMYVSINNNTNDSAPFTRVGINDTNNSGATVLEVYLDKNGADVPISPTSYEVVDNYGSHIVDNGGVDYFKTGFKAILAGAFQSNTTGSGIVRAAWLSAVGGNVNQALYVDQGDSIFENGGVVVGNPTGGSLGAGWINAKRINLVGVGTSNTTKSFIARDSANVESFSVLDDGTVSVRDKYLIDNSEALTFRGNSTRLCIGPSSGLLATGVGTIAIGQNSLSAATTGPSSIAIGRTALQVYTSSFGRSIAIGEGALIQSTTGGTNVGIGHGALSIVTGNSSSTAVGYLAGNGTNGQRNVFIGSQAGSAVVGQPTGINSSIGIGANAFTTKNFQMVIGGFGHKIEEIVIGAGVSVSSGFNFGALITTSNVSTTQTDQENFGTLRMAGGRSVGDQDGAGLSFETSPAGASGSTLNPLVVQMLIKGSGVINMPNLPTSSAGLVAGDLWNDSGTLKVI